jgi:high-affinity iron transporter
VRQLPYTSCKVHLTSSWAGLWLGLFPTWEGLLAQGTAAVFVLGSYFVAERLRKNRRRAILDEPRPATGS